MRLTGASRRVVWVTLAALLVAGVVAVRLQASPDSRAETAAGESEQSVFVPVEKGRLTARVITRGNVVAANPRVVLVAQPAPDRDAVLTKVPVVGQRIAEGEVLYELAGRPVFALQGRIPAYRDLKDGDSGEDVKQLQAALRRAGLYPGPLNGAYGKSTGAAIVKLYATHGHDPPSPPGQFLRREFAHFPSLPSVVQSVERRAASVVEPGSPLLTVSSRKLVVEVPFLDPGFERFIGRDAELFLDAGSTKAARGVVVGRSGGEQGAGNSGEQGAEKGGDTGGDVDGKADPKLLISSDALTTKHLDRNIKVTIVDRSSAEVTLLVPASAVITAGDGTAYVDKKQADGSVLRVKVALVDQADGTDAIRPGSGEQLAEGDVVRIGAR